MNNTASTQNTPTLMIQGCTSDAGKTTLVAALCRILHRRGVRVAPFKPQNMALNSAVTVDGGEIGRTQALQALAAGLEAHSDFNPVLLKPSTNKRAQVKARPPVLTASAGSTTKIGWGTNPCWRLILANDVNKT